MDWPGGGGGAGNRVEGVVRVVGLVHGAVLGESQALRAGCSHAAKWPPLSIVANPTYIGPGQPGPGHLERIIKSAATADYDGRWTFDTSTPAAIIKTQATESRPESPECPDPARTRGRDILVFGDVCTTGYQMLRRGAAGDLSW
jgi:hypothetical protein